MLSFVKSLLHVRDRWILMAKERWRGSSRGVCRRGGDRRGEGGSFSSLHAGEGGGGARLPRRCADPGGDGRSSISLALSRLNYQPWPQATFIELISSQLLDDLRGVNVVSPKVAGRHSLLVRRILFLPRPSSIIRVSFHSYLTLFSSSPSHHPLLASPTCL